MSSRARAAGKSWCCGCGLIVRTGIVARGAAAGRGGMTAGMAGGGGGRWMLG